MTINDHFATFIRNETADAVASVYQYIHLKSTLIRSTYNIQAVSSQVFFPQYIYIETLKFSFGRILILFSHSL